MYTSLSDYLKKEYGEKLYKLSLSSGCTCPTRDGSKAVGGCIFCSAGGSGDFAAKSAGKENGAIVTPDELYIQIEDAKRRVSKKAHADRYIAYFQSYTNTYGDIDALRELYTAAIKHPDISVLSVATRPDCLPDEVVGMLRELNSVKPVWVELGLQTSREESARYIRRGYENSIYKDAVSRLNDAGIKVVTHIILGLPGETCDDMKASLDYAVSCGTWGIKLQLLHVLSGTDLEKDYRAGMFSVMSLEEYVSLVTKLIQALPENIVVHRLTGDGPKKLLIAPLWSADKKRVLNTLNRELATLRFSQSRQPRAYKEDI